jgi:hypothetical protein
MSDKLNLKPDWIILLLVSLGAAVLGRPIGAVVAFLGAHIHDGSTSEWEKALIIWLQWTSWAVPLAMGVGTFAVGLPFVKWSAPARTKGKVLATGAIWLGYVVLVLAGNTYVNLYVGRVKWGVVVFGTLAIIPSVIITLLIWHRKLSGTQPPQ